MSDPKKPRVPESTSKKTRLAYKRVAPVMVPLLELFGTVDDVFTEEGAFLEENIKKSLGRIYRQWKVTRAALDPEFDPASYERKPRSGISTPPATASKKRSSDRNSTSDKKRKNSEKRVKPSRSTSAKKSAR